MRKLAAVPVSVLEKRAQRRLNERRRRKARRVAGISWTTPETKDASKKNQSIGIANMASLRQQIAAFLETPAEVMRRRRRVIRPPAANYH